LIPVESGPADRYGYFAIERVHGAVLTLPGGERQLFEDPAKAEDAWLEWVKENALPAAVQTAEEEREAFVAGCQVKEKRIKQPGLLNPDLLVREVLDPDDNFLGNLGTQDYDVLVEEAMLKRFPGPTVRTVAQKTQGGTEKVVVWAAGLYLDGEHRALPAISNWTFGLPIEGVLKVLNELAAEGWTVAHVSEDRGLYAGNTNQTDSWVTKARYLLTRSG
jgi:hypothetical protein